MDCRSGARDSWQRILIVLLSLSLAIARILYPTLNIDWVTVALVAIASLAVVLPTYSNLWPHLIKALPYIRKAKILGFEVELTEEIKNLSVDVEGAKETISTKRALRLIAGYEDTRTEVLNVVKSDPRAALMILAARIEQAVMLQLAKHRLRQQGTEIPMRSAMELGVQHGVFPAEVLKPFREFWDIRNRVAHGRAFDVDDSLILSLVSIGLEVLKLVSLEENDGSNSSE